MQEDEHRSWQCRFIGRVCELPVRANASVDQSANYQYRQNGRMSDLSEPSIPGRVYRFRQVIRNERSRSQGWRRLCEFLSTNMIGFRSYSFVFFLFPGGVSYSRAVQDNIQRQGFDYCHQRNCLNQRITWDIRTMRYLLGTIFPGFSLSSPLPPTP